MRRNPGISNVAVRDDRGGLEFLGNDVWFCYSDRTPGSRPACGQGPRSTAPMDGEGSNVVGRHRRTALTSTTDLRQKIWQSSGYKRVGGNRRESRRVALSVLRGPVLLSIAGSLARKHQFRAESVLHKRIAP